MEQKDIKELLSKQLQLLAQRSEMCASDRELAQISAAMIDLARLLLT